MELEIKQKRYYNKKKEILKSYSLLQYEKMLITWIKGRNVYIWSACSKSDWIYELCFGFGIRIKGFIDSSSSITKWNMFPVFHISEIHPEDSFIFVALEDDYRSVRKELEQKNFQEFVDFLYPLKALTSFGSENEGVFHHLDFRGNVYRGCSANITVDNGCRCYIGKNVRIDKDVKIKLSKNAVLIIEDYCSINGNADITVDDAVLILEKGCVIGKNFLARVSVKSFAVIGTGTSCGINFILAVSRMSYCRIGVDCMISDDVRIQASDSHEIYDIAEKENLWFGKKYEVVLGDHVWVGAKTIIRYGADIGKGSIVGIGSWVNKSFDCNVILAGNPAKTIKENIAWKREHESFDILPDSFLEFYYKDDN